jgi:4-methyl-5(b-hydroxyethyl)-thiazole monophosphate biosynthesis
MPGALNLENSQTVQDTIDYCVNNNLLISAICAAPQILGHKGILKGKNATCFPGFEEELKGAYLKDEKVVCDGNIITACGAGAAFEFGFKILEYFTDKDTANNLKNTMRF